MNNESETLKTITQTLKALPDNARANRKRPITDYLGRQGELYQALGSMGKLNASERRVAMYLARSIEVELRTIYLDR